METEFTKGSWVADVRVGCCAVYTKESRDEWEPGLHNDDRNIFYANYPNVTVKGDTKESIEHTANAHLIAAAPEMYKFLDDLANGRGTDYPIELLLAKARGEANE